MEDKKLMDPRCDIYSIGAVWFWLLTGRPPSGINLEATLRASTKVSYEYEQVLIRCLDRPESRYQTAEELARDIRHLQGKKVTYPLGTHINDNQVLVMAAVASHSLSDKDGMRLYAMQQELGGHMETWQLTIAYRSLLRMGFLAESTQMDSRGEQEHPIAQMTDAGLDWVVHNEDRIKETSEKLHDKQQEPEDLVRSWDEDIPF